MPTTLLVHETKPAFLVDILKNSAIRPMKDINSTKKAKRYNFTYLGVLFNHISLFPSNIKSPRFFENKSMLFFKSDLLTEQNPICYSPTWRFGDCSKKDSKAYIKTKSVEENIALWEEEYKIHTAKRKTINRTARANNFKLYKPLESFGQNELVFNDPIPMTHCEAIFQLGATFEPPESIRLLTTLDELEVYLREKGYSKKLVGGKTRKNK